MSSMVLVGRSTTSAFLYCFRLLSRSGMSMTPHDRLTTAQAFISPFRARLPVLARSSVTIIFIYAPKSVKDTVAKVSNRRLVSNIFERSCCVDLASALPLVVSIYLR